jgi:wyosine [tRNA(Phe)-imidazoG37] synthetase (radical SAM superfamily)
MLTISDHSRDSAGLTYIYPVLSRRSGGLSVGINLNTNNACNWRCIYCQVPDLKRGNVPAVDLGKLHGELVTFLDKVLNGNFFTDNNIPPENQLIRDIAISGNGEPTTAREFPDVVNLIGQVIDEVELTGLIKTVLITNGSVVKRTAVRNGLMRMAELNGEIWFKLDSATQAGMDKINSVSRSMTSVRQNIITAANLCPTWLQTCVFCLNGAQPSIQERNAYIKFLTDIQSENIPLRGVQLYSLARPSLQPESSQLSALPQKWLERFADQIRRIGIDVIVSQ